MPHSLKLPGMGCAVVPLVSSGDAVVDKLVPGRHPCFPAVVRALDLLSEPTTGLRRVQAIRINRRSFDVINFPASKVRAANLPVIALSIRRQDEPALACAHQDSNFAHPHYLQE